ncbi:MAG: DUF998 domain-containing protein [Anaerolineae bacterium]|nr:DUF998 domain-containing protein [Anaerolineae bacterium]
MFTEFLHRYRYPGLAGTLIILAATGLTAVFYAGRQRERYSPLNHFVSELGELGVSRLAWLFNGGLILGGVAFMPFLVGLGLSLNSVWGTLGMLAGLGASGACVAVGLLPMNRLAPHTKAAMTFFRLGLVTVLLFGIAIFAQPAGERAVPLAANLFGGLTALAYAAFLVFAGHKPAAGQARQALDPAAFFERRPRFWLLAMLEWAVFIATMLWFLGVALTLPG